MARPRSVACDHAILDAALAEYATNGLDGMSVDAVAARAGVSKATIYRRYPSKAALVVAAANTAAEEQAPVPDTGVLREDLQVALRNLRGVLQHPVLGAAKRMLLIDALRNEELARLHGDSVCGRRNAMLDMYRRAIARGELRGDIDLEIACDFVSAPVFYRHLVSGASIADDYLDHLVDEFIDRYGVLQSAGLAGPSRQS